MRNLALAMITLSLVFWRPAIITAQPAPAVTYQQDRDRDRDDRDRRDRDRDRDRDHDRNRMPRGSYEQTCRNIHMDGSTLKATCRKRDNRWRDTSLKHADRCREIENDNGRLQCR